MTEGSYLVGYAFLRPDPPYIVEAIVPGTGLEPTLFSQIDWYLVGVCAAFGGLYGLVMSLVGHAVT